MQLSVRASLAEDVERNFSTANLLLNRQSLPFLHPSNLASAHAPYHVFYFDVSEASITLQIFLAGVATTANPLQDPIAPAPAFARAFPPRDESKPRRECRRAGRAVPGICTCAKDIRDAARQIQPWYGHGRGGKSATDGKKGGHGSTCRIRSEEMRPGSNQQQATWRSSNNLDTRARCLKRLVLVLRIVARACRGSGTAVVLTNRTFNFADVF